jgi:pyroglutamyl-peptidase
MLAHPTIVLTGFGPFPGMPFNASAELVPRLADATRIQFPTHRTTYEVLPTQWDEAPARLRRLIGKSNVVLALHFGVSASAKGFTLELVGRNVNAARCDAVGKLPSLRVLDDGPDLLASTLPAERISARLKRLGLPCSTSDDAGGYLCNALLYHSLAVAHGAGVPHLAGFVHIPADLVGHGAGANDPHPDCALDWNRALQGSLEIVTACIEHIERRESSVKTG